jgi:hypothetical protein
VVTVRRGEKTFSCWAEIVMRCGRRAPRRGEIGRLRQRVRASRRVTIAPGQPILIRGFLLIVSHDHFSSSARDGSCRLVDDCHDAEEERGGIRVSHNMAGLDPTARGIGRQVDDETE